VSPDLVAETGRLRLRRFTADDAPFVLELLNDPDFLRNIGDRGVRTDADARGYILDGPVASYERNGFGLYLVELAASGDPIGMCGLVRREALPGPDIGFAFLPAWRGRGYGLEAARAVMRHAEEDCGLRRLVAIVSPGNTASRRLLERIGFRFEGMTRLADDAAEVELLACAIGGEAG
jgi:ribosomal-protein-alanine N-acetyltransferase